MREMFAAALLKELAANKRLVFIAVAIIVMVLLGFGPLLVIVALIGVSVWLFGPLLMAKIKDSMPK